MSDVLLAIWAFFQNNILTKPAFFVGFIVLLGYLLLKKPFYEALAGFIKATVGYMILNVASSGLVTNFRPILAGLNGRFKLNAAVIDPYFGQAAAQKAVEAVGKSFAMMMQVLLLAFIWNLVLVLLRKVTKVRTVFITGHIMVQQSSTALWLVLFAFPELQQIPTLIMLGLLLGTYWAVFSNLSVESTQELTGGGGFAIGHQQMFGIWLTDKLSTAMGKKKKGKAIEDLKLPGFLSIFNENVVATSILMTIFFGIIIAILGEPYMRELDTAGFAKTQNFIFYIVEKSLFFAVYVSILQLGVRMFVSELHESFQGISQKLLPGSLPAVDCAASYGFGHPNAITIGFLFGAVGQFIAILGLLVFKSPVLIITGFVPVFFDNATFAVFANKKGGLRAAMLIPFLSGLLQVIGGAFAAFYFQLGKYGGWHGNFDWDTLWPVMGWLIKNAQYVGLVVCIVAMLAVPQLQYYFGKYRRENYFKVANDFNNAVSEEAKQEAAVAAK